MDNSELIRIRKNVVKYLKTRSINYLLDNDTIEDIAQEVVISCHKNNIWDMAWVHSCANNQLKKYWHRCKRTNAFESIVKNQEHENGMDDNKDDSNLLSEEQMSQFINSLPEDLKQIIILKMDGHKIREIASITGMSIATVKWKMVYNKSKLRKRYFNLMKKRNINAE